MKEYDFIPLYTYEDYEKWEGKWELIHGHPHAMSPSPVRKHQLLILKLMGVLDNKVENACKHCKVYFDLDWVISNDTIVRPDIMIVCGEFRENFLRFPPTLIVEVISPATIMKDRNIKFRLYESQKVKYYIIIDPDKKSCDLYELQKENYTQNNNLKEFSLQSDCSISFDIPEYISQLDLD